MVMMREAELGAVAHAKQKVSAIGESHMRGGHSIGKAKARAMVAADSPAACPP